MHLPLNRLSTFESWNRRIHYFLGLYLLLFIWLFCFTGLLLNHPGWAFADFWPGRTQNTMELAIRRPPPGNDLDQARNILRQLGISGEIEWTAERENSGRFDFRVSRPGHMVDIRSDLGNGRATVQTIDVNAWGVMRILHTFTGVRSTDQRNDRDWILTKMWSLAMDATAAGLILMVLGGLYMWWRSVVKRSLGLLALGSGCVLCAFFVIGLKWIS
jgi:hypothetical protein